MSEDCTAYLKDEHCVLKAGHTDPEYGTDHAGPAHPVQGRLRWRDSAVGAVPHQTVRTEATHGTQLQRRIAAAIHRYDNHHALSGNDLPSKHHHGEAEAVLIDLLGPIPDDADTAAWTAVRAIQLMNEAGSQREAAEGRARSLEERLRLTTDQKVADLAGENIKLVCEESARLKAEVEAARKFAAEMRDFCSPHGVAVDYADRLIAAMDQAKEGQE